jgi:hypothetical protein
MIFFQIIIGFEKKNSKFHNYSVKFHFKKKCLKLILKLSTLDLALEVLKKGEKIDLTSHLDQRSPLLGMHLIYFCSCAILF